MLLSVWPWLLMYGNSRLVDVGVCFCGVPRCTGGGGGSEKEGGEACMQCAVLGGVFVSVPGCQRNTQRMRLLLHLSDNGCAA